MDSLTSGVGIDPGLVLLVGDTHSHINAYVDLVDAAKRYEARVLLHVGDNTHGATWDDEYLDAKNSILEREGLLELTIRGNHDALFHPHRNAAEPVDVRRRIVYLPDAFRWSWKGVRFAALGGAHSVDAVDQAADGRFHPEEVLDDIALSRVRDTGECDVLLSHDCPAGIDLVSWFAQAGRKFEKADLETAQHRLRVRRAVEDAQPRLVIHGHYHLDYEDRLATAAGIVRVIGLNCDGLPGSYCLLRLEHDGPQIDWIARSFDQSLGQYRRRTY